MIRKVLLDLDGPLLDGIDRHYGCYRDILRDFGRHPIEKERYWMMKRGRVDRRQQLAASQAEDLYEEFMVAWLERIETRPYLALDRLHAGAIETLSEWQNREVKVFLVTMRNNRANLLWQLQQLGVDVLLQGVVSVKTDEGATGKAAAARSLISGEPTAEILWIGDTEIDVEAARLLGIKVCAVSCGLRTSEFLRSRSPDMLSSSLASVEIFA